MIVKDFTSIMTGKLDIFGSCKGLICYAKCDGSARNIYMWNPAVRKLRVLPKPEFHMKPSRYGFWFDTDADDYKVAKISFTEVEVYSLSTNTWDTIVSSGNPGFQYQLTVKSNIVHLNGTLHWLLLGKDGWNIKSLNIKIRELCETLIWPVYNMRFSLDLLTSEIHSHSLFVLTYDSWLNHRRGVLAYDERLRQLYRIDLGTKARPIGIRENGNEFLFQKVWNYDGRGNSDGGILVSNVEDFKFKDFSPSTTRTIYKILPFAETLVLLNDKESSLTATSSTIRSMVRKARFAISGILYAMEKAISKAF